MLRIFRDKSGETKNRQTVLPTMERRKARVMKSTINDLLAELKALRGCSRQSESAEAFTRRTILSQHYIIARQSDNQGGIVNETLRRLSAYPRYKNRTRKGHVMGAMAANIMRSAHRAVGRDNLRRC